ncbi:hypothetical protein WISP_22452 [Willisornis vidua]|uniref:Uncharacterized protein n=1 Tax=Willisornis vidua TaxID=1566151 RepID=A0ABQ9DMU1_9PASS|nr:hypothetical protein WISP_22452 [Willisornis vidua]
MEVSLFSQALDLPVQDVTTSTQYFQELILFFIDVVLHHIWVLLQLRKGISLQTQEDELFSIEVQTYQRKTSADTVEQENLPFIYEDAIAYCVKCLTKDKKWFPGLVTLSATTDIMYRKKNSLKFMMKLQMSFQGSLTFTLLILSPILPAEVKKFLLMSKLYLPWFEAISTHCVTCYPGEEANPDLATTSFQVVVGNDMVSPEPPFLQGKYLQIPQVFLTVHVLQTLRQLSCLSLDMVQHLNVFLVVKGPELDTEFVVWPHQCPVHRENQCSGLAGHTAFGTVQDAIDLSTLMAHVQLAVR